MKKIILFSLFLTLTLYSSAQTHIDILYLKNGSIIRGELFELDENIKIKTADGSIWVFPKEEFLKTEKEVNENRKQSSNYRYNGMKYSTGFGLFVGRDQYGVIGNLSVDAQAIYAFKNKLQAGIGASLEVYENAFIPIGFTLGYQFSEIENSGTISAQIGYNIPIEENYDYYENQKNIGGLNTEIAYTYKKVLNWKSAFYVKFAYNYRNYKYSYDQYWWGTENPIHTEINNQYNRLSLHIGFTFN